MTTCNLDQLVKFRLHIKCDSYEYTYLEEDTKSKFLFFWTKVKKKGFYRWDGDFEGQDMRRYYYDPIDKVVYRKPYISLRFSNNDYSEMQFENELVAQHEYENIQHQIPRSVNTKY